MKKILLTILIAGSITCMAQSYREDFKKMLNYYTDSTNVLDYKIQVKLFDRDNVKNELQSMDGSFTIYKDLLRLRIGPELRITDSNYSLIVNDEENVLAISKRNASGIGYEKILPAADSIFAFLNPEVKAIDAPSGQKGYRLIFNKNVVDSVEYYFDVNSYKLSKVIYYYVSSSYLDADEEYKPVIQILLSDYVKRSVKQGDFSLSPFVRIENNKVIPLGKYSAYRLINNL